MKSFLKSFISILTFVLFLISCNTTGVDTIEETTTRGNIKIGVDESYRLLMDTEIYTFISLYNYTKITPLYKSELGILDDFINDSIRLMVTGRKLTQKEDEYLKSKSIYPKTTKIAYDALAFIVNKNNPDSLLRYNEIRDIFTGKIKSWNQINKKSTIGELKVVFDNDSSGNVRYIKEKFSLPVKFPSYCLATNTNEEVINYVEKHKNAIGLLSVNWISDPGDSVSHRFLKKVQVVSVTSAEDPDGNEFYTPHKGYVANRSYPFVREVYIINRETFDGLGTGLTAFIAGDQGQRIILRSGLVPATMPIRIMQIKSENIEVK